MHIQCQNVNVRALILNNTKCVRQKDPKRAQRPCPCSSTVSSPALASCQGVSLIWRFERPEPSAEYARTTQQVRSARILVSKDGGWRNLKQSMDSDQLSLIPLYLAVQRTPAAMKKRNNLNNLWTQCPMPNHDYEKLPWKSCRPTTCD